ncbi:hypothetical protein [Enterobacter cloacae]|uniref:hypothetical protein n=1 Tax=Enterobacter cloacae TaxID=550 RepID=UPI00292CB859|nr:hypothetical protein [Enterobacter cloacae]
MSTISKERLEQLASGNAWVCVQDDEAAELARIALASLEAEASGRNPVLAYADSYRDMANQGVESIPVWSVITDLERNIAPLFTAPPAPVVPDEAISLAVDGIMSTYADNQDECRKRIRNHIEDACRAAMQGAMQQEETVKSKK